MSKQDDIKTQNEMEKDVRSNESKESENKGKETELGLATELLHELIEQNKRLEEQNKRCCRSLNLAQIITFLMVVVFVVYLLQYDFTSQIEQTGVYTFVDSEGNVISSDITAEEMEKIFAIINDGKSEDKKN